LGRRLPGVCPIVQKKPWFFPPIVFLSVSLCIVSFVAILTDKCLESKPIGKVPGSRGFVADSTGGAVGLTDVAGIPCRRSVLFCGGVSAISAGFLGGISPGTGRQAERQKKGCKGKQAFHTNLLLSVGYASAFSKAVLPKSK